MPDTAPKPVVLLAFANDHSGKGAGFLPTLSKESDALIAIFEEAEGRGHCKLVPPRQGATLNHILDIFQHPAYHNRIAIFHYGGHANGYQLLLETAQGHPAVAHAGGLAAFLGQQAQQGELKLVFLNGCSTEPQVQGLLDAGVPAVVATAQAIDDAIATAFATCFYQALAAGDGLRSAFVQAEGAVKAARGDIPRHLYAEGVQPEAADRWPWTLYLRPGAEVMEQWNLPAAAGDLLFGLPPLPKLDLPESPYRYLDWYRQQDAELFFGRGRTIRDLYTRLTASDSAPIVLFYGQSGVGKSSLLAAGLLPRLAPTHTVVYLRRDQTLGLLGTLTTASRLLCATAPGLGWLSTEQQAGQPLVVILDQLEEVFTRSNQKRPDELGQLFAALQGVFGDATQRPQGKLILSFRKEWLAEIQKQMEQYTLPRARVFLERLDRAGIIEVVMGPTRIERLQRHYGLRVEAGLAEEIAGDLLADPDSPVATMLQILLAKLWEQATQRSPSHPVFDSALYQAQRRHGLALDAFLDEQLHLLRQTHADAVDSGLEIDLLAGHTTAQGTAEQSSAEALAEAYPHHPDLPVLVQRNKDLYLLSDAGGEGSTQGVTRLAHDTLAPLVRLRFEKSDASGQRARRILENRAVEWQAGKTGTPLDEADLALVEAGATGMRAWSEAEVRLIEASRQASLQRAEERRRNEAERAEAQRRERTEREARAAADARAEQEQRNAAKLRRRNGWLALALAAALLLAGAAGYLFNNARIARQTAEANEDLAVTREAEARDAQAIAGYREQQALAAEATAVVAQAETAALKDVIEANRLVAEAEVAGNERMPQRRLLLALEALKLHAPNRYPLPVAQTALHAALSATGGIGLGGHKEIVSTLAFSPDGRWLATGSYDSTAWLWDVQDPTADPVVLRGHEGPILALAFSPDGRWLATGSGDATVRLWDVQNLSMDPFILSGHENRISTLAFSPDGRWLATGSGDATVRLWDVQNLSMDPFILSGHEEDVTELTFTPDGHWLATGSPDTTVRLWNVHDPIAEPVVLNGHEKIISALAFSPDGNRLAILNADGTLRLSDMYDPIADPIVVREDADFITALVFSPDGVWLATGSADSTVQLSNVQDPSADPVTLRGPEGGITTLAFSLDGRWLAAGSGDVYGGGDRTVRVWGMADLGAEPAVLRGPEGGIIALAFSPDGAWLATSNDDNIVRLWDIQIPSADPIKLSRHESSILALSFSPDGRWLTTGGEDNTVQLWDMQDLHIGPSVLTSHELIVSALAFSPHGLWLATGSMMDRIVRLWDMQDPTADPVELSGHEGLIWALAFSPDERWLATGGDDMTVRLWDVQNPTTAPIGFSGHEGYISALAFSPNGRWLASGSKDSTVRLWDMQDFSADPRVLRGHDDDISTLAFSPDSRRLASGSGDVVRLWDVQSLSADPIVFSGHTDWITTMAFSPDGRWLASGSGVLLGSTSTVRLWDVQDLSADPIVLSGHADDILAMAFSPDGTRLATGSKDLTVQLWRVSLSELSELACRTAGRNLTQEELDLYFRNEPNAHRQTCPHLPPHPSVASAPSS